MRRRATWGALPRVMAIGLLAGALPVSAGDEAIQIMVGGIDKQIYLPVVLAESLGYFRRQGLEVQLRSETSGMNAADQLLTGASHGVVGFYDHTIDLQAKGKFVQCVVQFSQAPGEAEVVATRVAAQVRSPADFEGRTLGVTGLGSSTHLLTRYLASTSGVKYRDMRIVSAGSGASFIKALREGRIDAGMASEPTVSNLLRSGEARLMIDLRTPQSTASVLGGIYPGACLYMNNSWVGKHRPEVQKLVTAIVAALRFIDSHSAEDIAASVPVAYHLGGVSLYVEGLRASKSMFLVDGAMPPDGPATVLRVLKTVNRAVHDRPINLSLTYTNEFTSAAR
jgi:NitT/TauT family transport system substrate-binding protein